MSNIITFGNTILGESGKRGILTPIEKTPGGDYYLINAGGFNIPNRGGVTYRFNDYVKECMRPDSDFNRRVTEGQMMTELGHPPMYYHEMVNGVLVRTKITDVFEWVQRLRTVEDDRVCGHVRRVHFVKTGGDNAPVFNQIEVCAFGVHKQILEDSFKNPDINTAFSIRTVTKPQKFGDTTREVEYWSTYDLVIEQGMLNACKHRTAGLEDFMNASMADQNGCELTTTFDELFTFVENKFDTEEVQLRFAGNESFRAVDSMIQELKKRNKPSTKINLYASNSLDAFK